MKEIDDAAVKDMQDIEAKYSADYLARVDALTAIEKGKPHIRTVRQFILIFCNYLLSPTAKNGMKLSDQISPFSFKMDSPHRLQSQFPHR